MSNMRRYIDIIKEIAMPPEPGSPPEPSISDTELKRRLIMAARYGWSKPQKGTEMRDKLDTFMNDLDFRSSIEEVRPEWLTGEGDSHVGTMHWSKLP